LNREKSSLLRKRKKRMTNQIWSMWAFMTGGLLIKVEMSLVNTLLYAVSLLRNSLFKGNS
jgi:uncharacterized membrane protein YedE/YeeE